jgi:hypothetical protein
MVSARCIDDGLAALQPETENGGGRRVWTEERPSDRAVGQGLYAADDTTLVGQKEHSVR